MRSTTRVRAAKCRGAARVTSLALAWLLAMGVASAVCAQPADSAELEREAGTHFEKGVELYSEGSLDAALVEFERAYELVPSYRLLYNLAQIQAEKHEYAAALGLFDRYLEEGKAELSASRKQEVLAELAKLRERVAQLWVETDVEGAKLFVDDELVGALPLARPVLIDPGVCRVRVEKPGYRSQARQLKVVGGDQPRLNVPLREHAEEGEAEREGPAGDATSSYRAFWISSASAVALGGASLSFGLLTRSANRALDAKLDSFPARPDDLAEDRSQVKTYAALTDGFGAAAIVATGLAVYFLIDPPKSPPAGRELSVGSSLRLLPSAKGLGLYGKF